MDVRNGEVAMPESLAGGRGKPDTRNRYWTSSHDVQFYDSDETLATTVAGFLVEAIRLGQPIAVIATTEHRKAVQDHLREMGVTPDEMGGEDALWLDARDALASFMVDGMPDEQRFQATLGATIARLGAKRPNVMVRAFGEMVDLLWRDGKMDAAIELETLWNRLATRHEFALLCAYSRQTLTTGDPLVAVERICRVHTRLLPFIGSPSPEPN
jgi:hypothetical protein